MRDTTIARNYADTFLALATKADDRDGWGKMLSDFADAIQRDDRLRQFLEAPNFSDEQKNAVIGKAFADRMPRPMLRYLQAVVRNRRQRLIPEIATEYHALVDELEGRVHAQVTVAREPSAEEQQTITASLSRVFSKLVVPHFSVNAAILGGVIVRVGDTVMDGSVRRRLATLRGRMVGGARA